MNKSTEPQKITKIDAAIRQVDAAIRMYLADEDALAIHTVISAANQILSDLATHQGKRPQWENLIDLVIPEKQSWMRDLFRQPQNFLKHADKDPDDILEYRAGLVEFHIMVACMGIHDLTTQSSPEVQGFETWFFLRFPEISAHAALQESAKVYIEKYGKPDSRDDKKMIIEIIEMRKKQP